MKSSLLLSLAAASASTAEYVCPAQPSMLDAKSIGYGYVIQGFLQYYYESVPVNASFFSDTQMASTVTSNGKTHAEKLVTNFEGLQKQATLGANALMKQGGMLGLSPPKCNFTFPPAPNGMAHVMNAYYIEATLCGAFIGLADYFQSPTLNFLSARLSAEHGIHASFIGSMMKATPFMANSTMLTPAFTPEMVLQSGMDREVGKLGSYFDCAPVPSAPCGGMVEIGEIFATLTGQSSTRGMGNSTSGGSSSGSSPGSSGSSSGSGGSSTQSAPATFTGAANTLTTGAAVGVTAMALLAAFLMS